jgi:membrane-bound metal-dependent hydrolase YbcI (DUF457 family)
MALAYLLGKASAKPFNLNPNIPLLLVLSILPDIDIIFERIFQLELHRGPTHSIIVAILIFIPFFLVYRQRTLPYFLAFASHALVGDFLIGGQIQLLWPFSTAQYGLHELGSLYIGIFDPINIHLELTLFLIATIILFKSNDIQAFFKKSKLNFILIIPILTVLLPTMFGYPFSDPLLFTVPQLALPHFFYLLLFSIAILNLIFPVYAHWLKNIVLTERNGS